MKRTAFKTLALAAALLTAFGMAGCQTAAPTAAPTTAAATSAAEATTAAAEATATPAPTTAAPSYLTDASPVTFDWYVDCSWYTTVKWGRDITSQYITKKTGVTLNIVLPTGNEAEKKNLMIATGEVPDFVSMGGWETARLQMVEAGLLFSLDELAEKYAPDFWDVTTPSSVGWFREKDGKLYGYPNCNWPLERVNEPYNQAQLLSYVGLTVRKDIYEAIGSPDMTTPEGFLNALKAAKEKYPQIDGQDLIPFSFGTDFNETGNAVIGDVLPELLNIPYTDARGQLVNRLTDPEYITWLKTFRKANEMGLLPKEIFIDKTPQIDEEFKAGRVFATFNGVNTMLNSYNGPMYQKDPNSYYIQVEGPQNSRKEKCQFKAGGLAGWLWTAISKTNRNPERAIRFMQYWLSEEGQADFYLSDPAACRGGDGKLKKDIFELSKSDGTKFNEQYAALGSYFMLSDVTIQNKWATTDRKEFEKEPYEFQYGRFKDVTVLSGIDPSAESEAGIELQKSRTKWGTLLPKMLLAKTDAELEQYMSEYKAVDDEARKLYAPIQQANYEANKKKLGQ